MKTEKFLKKELFKYNIEKTFKEGSGLKFTLGLQLIKNNHS